MKIELNIIITLMVATVANEKVAEIWKPLDTVIDSITNNTVQFNNYIKEQQEKAANSFRKYYENMPLFNQPLFSKNENKTKLINDDLIVAVPVPLKTQAQPEIQLGSNNPHVNLNVPGSIAAYGYKSESHTIVTEDGYILTLHRIPQSKKRKELPKKTVLLQHGIFGSSADWTMAGPERSLAYILSDEGYDVWMSNLRGNTYSRQHVILKPDSQEFWNFTWHEAAQYDLPANIKYIKKLKHNCDLHYIGHSMGTTLLITLLALRPEFNSILKSAVLLSPVVYMSDVRGPVSFLKTIKSPDNEFSKLFDSYELSPTTIFMKMLSQTSCDLNSIDKLACQNAMFSFSGYDNEQMDPNLLPVITSHSPAGVSSKTLIHYAQEVRANGKFQMFDYGAQGNMERYGNSNPPEYNVDNITLPIALIWSKNDWISGKADVDKLYSKLKNPIEFYTVSHEKFNHIDFLWARDVRELVYNKVIEIIKKSSQ